MRFRESLATNPLFFVYFRSMISVEPALFSNIIITVQRTNSLAGGSVSGLPNGVVIEGLKGVSSFGSDISEAQKE